MNAPRGGILNPGYAIKKLGAQGNCLKPQGKQQA